MADCLLATSISRLDSESNMAAKFFSWLKAVFHFCDSPWPFMKLSYFALGATVAVAVAVAVATAAAAATALSSTRFKWVISLELTISTNNKFSGNAPDKNGTHPPLPNGWGLWNSHEYLAEQDDKPQISGNKKSPLFIFHANHKPHFVTPFLGENSTENHPRRVCRQDKPHTQTISLGIGEVMMKSWPPPEGWILLDSLIEFAAWKLV